MSHPLSLARQFEQMEARAREHEALQERAPEAAPAPKEGCQGSYWSSPYQGPCWVCNCCADHGCKDSSKHCHCGFEPGTAVPSTKLTAAQALEDALAQPTTTRDAMTPPSTRTKS